MSDDTKEALANILEALNEQNKNMPSLIFKVDILWKVLCVIAGATLLGFLTFMGSLIVKGGV